MNATATNTNNENMSGDTIQTSDIKIGDQLAYEDSADKVITVVYIDENVIRADDSQSTYVFPRTNEYKNILDNLFTDSSLSEEEEGGTDTEGEEGEADGADFSFKRFGLKVINTVGDGTGWVKRKTYDKIVNRNDDIINPRSKSIRPSDLLPGDILLKKMHEDDATSSAIHKAQLVQNGLRGYQESEKLTHAMIYAGDGKVIEAVDNGIGISPLRAASSFNEANYNDYDFFVLRCRNARVRDAAVDEAKGLLFPKAAASMANFEKGTPVRVKYDHKNLYLTIGYKLASSAYKLVSPIDFEGGIDNLRSLRDSTKRVKEQVRDNNDPKLFCSELVAYCYHAAADECGIPRYFQKKQQSILSPEHLYVYGREDGGNFEYMGRLPARVS